MYKKGMFPFNKPNLFPDATVPKGIEPGSAEHARYIFHSVSLDSRARAEGVYQAMDVVTQYLGGKLERLVDVDNPELAYILSQFVGENVADPGINKDSPVRTLKENAIKLYERYGSDPRRLYD